MKCIVFDKHVNLRQRRDRLLGAKSFLCHCPTAFSKLNSTANLAQKEPVAALADSPQTNHGRMRNPHRRNH